MPLHDQFHAYNRQLSAFLSNPEAPVLFLTADPEMQGLGARLLAGAEADPESNELFFANCAPFLDAATYYEHAAKTVLDGIRACPVPLETLGIEIARIAPLDLSYGGPAISAETRFAEFLERLARLLGKDACLRTVVILAAPEPSDRSAFLASTLALASVLGACRAKCVVITAPVSLPADLPPAQRLAALHVAKADATFIAAVRDFIRAPSRRLLVAHVHGPSDADLLDAIRVARKAVDLPTHRLSFTLDASSERNLARKAIEDLWDHAQRRSVKLDTPNMSLAGIDRFADLCERFAQEVLPDRGVLTVSLHLSSTEEAFCAEGAKFVRALNEAATSPRVRYLVLERTETGILPPFDESPRRVAHIALGINAASLEADLNAMLANPRLPANDRIQVLLGLAGFASARQDPERALALQEQALALAEEMQDPTEPVAIWLSVANTSYRAQQWSLAERAFKKALSLALDVNVDARAAEATLGLANSLLRSASYDDSAAAYRSAVDWYDKLGSPLFACHARTWLGECRRRAGDTAAAESSWVQTLEQYKALGPDLHEDAVEGQAHVLSRLMRLCTERGDRTAVDQYQHEFEALGHTDAFVPKEP